LVIIGAKINGRYNLRGFVKSTPRQTFDSIPFLIDSSENFTIISIPDAIKNNIDYTTFKTGNFEICDRDVEAYIYPDCELSVFHNDNPVEPHKITLTRVLIPSEDAFRSQPKANISRLGLDFLENFKITFQDNDMMILVPVS